MSNNPKDDTDANERKKAEFKLYVQSKDELIIKQTCLKCSAIWRQNIGDQAEVIATAKYFYHQLKEDWN